MSADLHIHVSPHDPSQCWEEIKALLMQLHEEEMTAMTVLSDKIAALGASLDAALARVDEDVKALQAQVAALQALIDQGVATPADIAALEAAQAKLDALDPTKPDTLPPA
jgi:hypothetical protein